MTTPVSRLLPFLFAVLLSGFIGLPLQAKPAYQEIEWIDLMPEEDLEALLNPPEWINEIADGSVEDQISSQMALALEQAHDDRYQQALRSTKTKAEYHNKKIRVPGFVVPLAFNDKQQVTRFFLVPYFGACIHVPPPPPNQMIYADYPKGLTQEELYIPFWLEGTLKAATTTNDVATSAYSMVIDNISEYTEE